MRCRTCGSDTRVLNSRKREGIIRRRRVCDTCGGRFTTREVRVEDMKRLQSIVNRFVETTLSIHRNELK